MKSFFCSFKEHLVRLRSIKIKHNLQSAIFNMPKQKKHTAALKEHRQKVKEKTQKYSPGIVTLKVLGSGAVGSPRCLYVFTDQSRYLFNCGEGTQRLAHEHKMRLGKLEHIFFTHGSWENIGGLPGISLTIQDVGVPEITLHGPQGIADIFSATRRFIVLKDLSVKNADYTENPYFEDNVMRISYVPLNATVEHRSRKRSVSWDRSFDSNERAMSVDGAGSSCTDGSTTDDETDYYAHERGGSVLPTVSNNKKKKRRRSRSKNRRSTSADGNNDDDVKRRKTEAVGNVAMGYIGKLHARPGALCLDACVERGVPPGPLLGRLKAGEDVTLPNGKVVKSKDVTSPDEPGPIFIVVECPDERFLDSLEKEPQFKHHQSRARKNDIANLVVHFTPPHIVWNPRYRKWMDKFSSSTQHLMINEANDCMGSIAVHRIQYKLNLLDPEIFPLLSDTGIPIVRESSNSVVTNGFKDCDGANNNDASGTISVSACPSSDNISGIYQAKTFSVVQLRPNKPLDSSNELILKPDDYEKEIFKEEGMKEALEVLHKKLEKCTTKAQKYPSVLFLGTGSCIPNKTRNTSGILLNIEKDHSMLLDCGEGTYGQLVRFHGKENLPKLMSSLKAIYVSHLHADHHIGLIGLLKAKRRYTKISNTLYLLAPKQIMTWLKYYHDHFEPILEQVQLIPNGDLIYDEVSLAKETKEKLYKDIQMSSILTCIVKHCPNAFGIALKHKSGWKLTYSGDTMPTDSLVEIGKDSTVLIHEATMEDELEHEARVKMHSTTSEAIEIGKKMSADFILLTHFSQRYATLPRFNEHFSNGIGIAFDNMKVRLSDLHKLPLLYPSLKLMFATHQDELELKAHRRLLKQGLTETSKSTSRSRSSSPRR